MHFSLALSVLIEAGAEVTGILSLKAGVFYLGKRSSPGLQQHWQHERWCVGAKSSCTSCCLTSFEACIYIPYFDW